MVQNQEISFPLLSFIHEMNECLLLWVSDAENFMYNMDAERTLSKYLEGISMNAYVNKGRRPIEEYLHGSTSETTICLRCTERLW